MQTRKRANKGHANFPDGPPLTYAGNLGTRRVRLADDEEVLREAFVFRSIWTLLSMGTLTMTSQRLIWTPTPLPWDFRWRAVDKEDIDAVSVHRNSRWVEPVSLMRWSVEIEARGKKRRFFAPSQPASGYRAGAEEWTKAIRQWANLSV
jgi:hypothetical protein